MYEELIQANWMIDRGIKLSRKIRDTDLSTDSHQMIVANWCETRLLMHRSAIISRMRRCKTDGAFEDPTFAQCKDEAEGLLALDPMGTLSDAEAKLRVSDARRSRAELAMIDLHRADAKLCEAENVMVSTGETLPKMFISLSSVRADQIKERVESKNIAPKELQKVSSLVADCIRFLNLAEPTLRERRRNVWWTTWYFERKLRAIALSVLVSALDPNTTNVTPIPFLGVEAAMRKTETEADRLLNDAIRMIRVDAYRLATVIDAYIVCCKALKIHLALDGRTEILPIRQAQMQTNIRQACSALDVTWANRAKSEYGDTAKVPPSHQRICRKSQREREATSRFVRGRKSATHQPAKKSRTVWATYSRCSPVNSGTIGRDNTSRQACSGLGVLPDLTAQVRVGGL